MTKPEDSFKEWNGWFPRSVWIAALLVLIVTAIFSLIAAGCMLIVMIFGWTVLQLVPEKYEPDDI